MEQCITLEDLNLILKNNNAQCYAIRKLDKHENPPSKESKKLNYWECKCNCGKTFITQTVCLKRGSTKSCGCLRFGAHKDLTGKMFGLSIKVLSQVPSYAGAKYITYNIVCDTNAGGCGRCKVMRYGDILIQKTCGCRNGTLPFIGKPVHGDSRKSKFTYLVSTLKTMIRRCYKADSHNYDNYGGRGIKVYEDWCNKEKSKGYIDFKKYILDNLGERPDGYSLDRIDVNGNYEPGNLRWSDTSTQNKNRRSSIYICNNGNKENLIDVARSLNVNYDILYRRYKKSNCTDIQKLLIPKIKSKFKQSVATEEQKFKYKISKTSKAIIKRFGYRIQDDLTFEQVKQIYKNQQGICKTNHICHTDGKAKLTIDHIVPLSKGGFHTENNIQFLCRSCNCSKGTNNNPFPLEERGYARNNGHKKCN